MTHSRAMLLHVSLCALASGIPGFLPDGTTLPYSELRTTGFTKNASYQGDMAPAGIVSIRQEELMATSLIINMEGVDPYCPENRSGQALQENGCAIYVDMGECSDLKGHYFNREATIIDPWRKGNYGWNVIMSQTSKTEVDDGKVLAGTALNATQLVGKAVVVHDSAGEVLACGTIGSDINAAVTLSKSPTYQGTVQFESGTVQVSVVPTKVSILTSLQNANGDGTQTQLQGVDDACTADYNKGNPIPIGGCGIQVYDATSCDGDAQGHVYAEQAEGSRDPWLDVRYAVTGRTIDGTNNVAEVKSPQPVFTAEELSGLRDRALIIHDAEGNKVSCSLLQAWGEVPDYTTLATTTAAPEESSSIPWWGILLIALGAAALIGGIIAAVFCAGGKKRGLKKKSSKKRALPKEELPIVNEPAPQPSVAAVPVYATPAYQPVVSHALPVYAAPVSTYAAPAMTYAAPAATYAHQAATYVNSGASVYAAQAAQYAGHTAPIPTYSTPVATYQPGATYS